MKLFGSLSEVVSVIFRNLSSNQPVTLRENQAVTYTAARDVQLPPQDANGVLVSATSTQTLSNKTISGLSNTITDISVSSATGTLPAANGGTGVSSTATFPTSGVVVTEAATETLTNKTISGASNTITNVSLTTGITGILPIANGGTNATTKTTAFDSLSPMTTSGDIIYGATSGTGTRLSKGTDGQYLTLSSGIPAWATITALVDPMTTRGDMVYRNSSNVTARLGHGTAGQLLTSDGTDLSWQAPAAATSTTAGVYPAPKEYVRTLHVSQLGSFVRTVVTPYQTVDGAWRAKINSTQTITTTTLTTTSLSFLADDDITPGLIFKNVANFAQAMCAFFVQGANTTVAVPQAYANANSHIITVTFLTATPFTGTGILSVSGDVELNGKPVFAD